jgi:hypothetical protein
MIFDFNPQTKVLTITSPNPVVINADIHCSGNIYAGYGGADQVDLLNHTHSGVQTGGSNTEKPNAGT